MIIVRDTDLPAGVTAQQAVALVYGPERAAKDLIVTIRTKYGPPMDTAPAAPLSTPTDSRSAAQEILT